MDLFVVTWSLFYKGMLLIGMAIAICYGIKDLDAKTPKDTSEVRAIIFKWSMLVLLVPGWVITLILTIIQIRKLGDGL